jgi:hypothetical protein
MRLVAAVCQIEAHIDSSRIRQSGGGYLVTPLYKDQEAGDWPRTPGLRISSVWLRN